MTVLLVTGTGTGVGKTVVTAAVAASATAAGLDVAVVKPAQTGTVPGGTAGSDIDTVVALAAPAGAAVLATYPDLLAPLAAARESGRDPLVIGDVIQAVSGTAGRHDLVLVEGCGGLLAPMGAGWTVVDLAMALGAPAVVVTRAGLGALNHTALTLEALNRRQIPAVVVIGAWPAEPELVHWANLTDLPGELAGILPAGAASLEPATFRARAPGWFTARLWGRADAGRLRVDGAAVPA